MRASFLCLVLLTGACASIGSSGAGDVDLPNAGVGPFRKLDGDETLGIAPYLVDDRTKLFHDPSVIPADPASDGPAAILFAAGTVSGNAVIVRTRAEDGRSFFGTTVGTTPEVVLRADAPGQILRTPAAARIGDALLLYYADGSGIRVATTPDGHAFTPAATPALAANPTIPWEKTPPDAPSVVVYPDGRVRMIYGAGGYFGEAESHDGGMTFARIAEDPIFGPSLPVDPSTLAPGEKPPFDVARVDDPCVAPRITPDGRLHIRVLYTGTDAAGVTAIGLAARYGDEGPLSRQAQPVFAIGKGERGPALLEWSFGTLLYVGLDRAPTSGPSYSTIAGAFSPANLRLPAATTTADSP